MDHHEKEKLSRLFFPHAANKIGTLQAAKSRFVHYSSAEAALSIVRNKEFWMRPSHCMNDFLEIEHGRRCLTGAWRGEFGERLRGLFENLHPGLVRAVAGQFDEWLPSFQNGTWLACLSEHNNDEDEHGRLSMWRAYGGSTGVALVLKGDVFFEENDALGVVGQPVAYLSETQFENEFGRVVAGLEREQDFLARLPPRELSNYLFAAFQFAILCTKHPGFAEEKEWRIIHVPKLYNSSNLKKDITCIRGTPQVIYKIPLKNIPERKFSGIEIPELIDRIIIGPCSHPLATRTAFVEQLERVGVPNPERVVFSSGIPLRQIS